MRRLAAGVTLALAFGLVAMPAAAQQAVPATTASPAARAEDVASLDAIIAALYDVISGPAGQKRDWDRFRSLFVPGARMIPTARTPAGEVRHRVQTAEDYIGSSGVMLEQNGFFERELGRTVETYGNITHAFSAYEARATPNGAVIARGINSIQLLNDGRRWWVVTVFWDSESPTNPIPAKYLNNSNGGRE